MVQVMYSLSLISDSTAIQLSEGLKDQLYTGTSLRLTHVHVNRRSTPEGSFEEQLHLPDQ
jgi:hypothetical protein